MQATVFSKSNIGKGLDSGRLLKDVGFDESLESGLRHRGQDQGKCTGACVTGGSRQKTESYTTCRNEERRRGRGGWFARFYEH